MRVLLFLFFFSSRRRHTRYWRDWSSDVCSSDLARGLIGFRTEFLTETRGTGVLHHVFDRWEPWAGELMLRPTGSLVSDRRGTTAQFALMNLQERGTLFVGQIGRAHV